MRLNPISTPAQHATRQASALLAALLLLATPTHAAARQPTCKLTSSPGTEPFTGLYPAIEGKLELGNFVKGQIVEIDPRTNASQEEAREYIAQLQKLGARVSIYLVGGHCDIGPDCDGLPKDVQLGSTGSWKWDQTEKRIYNVTHPAVMKRIADGIEGGWRLGANTIRVDNLHNPAGASHPRSPPELRKLIDLGHDIEDRLRNEGVIPPDRSTGLVAHNSLASWAHLIRSGQLRRLPTFLTTERSAQLAPGRGFAGDQHMKAGRLKPDNVPDLTAGRRLAAQFKIPYTVVEFRKAHDLAKSGETYDPPRSYVERLSQLTGVSEVIIVPHEDSYIGRAEVLQGPGPKFWPLPPAASKDGKRAQCK